MVEELAAGLSPGALESAAARMSEHYREGRPTRDLKLAPEEKAAAYLVTRMPATYASANAVMCEVRRGLEGLPVASLLDLGAGAGAAALAARAIFPGLDRLTLLEPDPALAGAGRRLLPDACWIEQELDRVELPPHDIVVASYFLGELTPAARAVDRAWQAARIALIVIEPGTPRGFALVRGVRDRLLARGARTVAPCPGDGACPMAPPDWCHFARRVERTSPHRRAKRSALGYEDEKFSYAAMARAFAGHAPGRILRRPGVHAGWVELTVCEGGGIGRHRVSRKEGAVYRAARKAAWGGAWPPGPSVQ